MSDDPHSSRPQGRGFLVTTFVLGLFLLIPIFTLLLVVIKAVKVFEALMAPLARLTQTAHLVGIPMPRVLAITALLLLVFVAGLLARSRIAQRGVGWLEQRLLTNIPGYALLKSMAQGAVGLEGDKPSPAVLLRLDDAWQIALHVDSVPDGRVVVFVPDARSAGTGSVLVVAPERIQPLGVPPAAALKCLRGLGSGAGALVARVR